MIQNRSGILVSAEAVQTIVQLMGEQELYNYHQGTFAVSSMDWTQDKARQILEVKAVHIYILYTVYIFERGNFLLL